jgi:hypothetical protein
LNVPPFNYKNQGVKTMTTASKRYTSHPPKITLEQALDARFVLGDVTYAVRTCPVSVLKHLVESKIEGTKTKELLELPAMLEDDESEVVRWFVLETLMRHKFTIPFAA